MHGGSVTTSAEPKVKIGTAVGGLAAAFPSGASDPLQAILAKAVERGGFADEATEAVTRLIHSREKRGFPPVAEVLRFCRQVRSDSQTARGAGRGALSYEEMNDLALRRLRYVDFPLDNANVEAELQRMKLLGWYEASGS